MIISMTGYGSSEGIFENKKYFAEARSVNSRFLEIFFKYPKKLSSKDFELKEIVKGRISRGKINISLTIDNENDEKGNVTLDEDSIKDYYELLNSVKKFIGSDEEIKLDHMLKFTDLFTTPESEEVSEEEFNFIVKIVKESLEDLVKMKKREGKSLEKDMLQRIKFIEKESSDIKKITDKRASSEKKKLKEKIFSYLDDKTIIDEKRLETEVAYLIERIDITEELIRLKSHTKYFIDYSKSDELAGRRLNFLTQEINREINTIASKSSDAVISQKVTVMKEELEKIREQLQNVE